MDSRQDIKLYHVAELILVIFVAFVPRIFSSTYILFTGTQLYNLEEINVLNCYGIISELTAIALLL